jgi:hypothetical protein
LYCELNITTYHKPVYPAVIMDTLPQRRQVLTGSAIRLSDPMTQTIIALGRMEWTAKGRLTGWVPDRLLHWLKSMPMSKKPKGLAGSPLAGEMQLGGRQFFDISREYCGSERL